MQSLFLYVRTLSIYFPISLSPSLSLSLSRSLSQSLLNPLLTCRLLTMYLSITCIGCGFRRTMSASTSSVCCVFCGACVVCHSLFTTQWIDGVRRAKQSCGVCDITRCTHCSVAASQVCEAFERSRSAPSKRSSSFSGAVPGCPEATLSTG